MKALVTGATGFVGRHLLARLELEGVEAIGLGSSDVDLGSEPALVESHLSKLIDSIGANVVYHLAGPKHYAPPEVCERICVSGTTSLLRALDAVGRELRLVAAGSSAEYGYSSSPGQCFSEEHPTNPSTPYGVAKMCQTNAILEWGGVVLRLFNCVGPGQGDDVVSGRIVHQLASGSTRLAIREVASKRDFVDVRDAAEAFLLAATELPPGVYNVCSGKSAGIDELIEAAFEAAGTDPIPVEVEVPDATGSFQCGDPSKIESYGWVRQHKLVDSLRDAIVEARKLYGMGVPPSARE